MAKGDSYAASQLFMGLTPKNGYKASKLYCYKPTDGSGDFTWARNINSYRLNQSGVLELMGNNVPRIDYTNTCPELLIEGERTNLLLRSQELDNGAVWVSDSGGTGSVIITANYAEAPNSTTTADRIQYVKGSGYARLQQFYTATNGVEYTFSIYAKALSGTPTLTLFFDGVDTNKVTLTSEWVRYTRKITATGTDIRVLTGLFTSEPTTSATADVLLWGAQLEQASYESSYIPTTTASVTRPQDTNSSDIAFTGDGFSYNLRVRLENRSDSGTPDNIFFIEDISGTSDTYAGIYVLGDSLYFTFYNNPDIEEYSITLPDGIHNLGVSLDCNNGAYEIVVDGVSQFSGALTNGFNSANIYERVKLGCLAASTDSIGLNRIIGLQVYDAVLTQGELIEYTS
jgi:hypothetical protein